MSATVFIVNPTSSSGRTARRIARLTPTIKHLFQDSEILFTQRPFHATQLTKHALKNDALLVVSVGGDGTLNEVVNGFFEHGKLINPRANVAMIMSGTGADFRRTLGWPGDITKELYKIKEGEAKAVDIGIVDATQSDETVRSRYFINASSVGLTALAAAFVHDERMVKNRFAYFLAGLRANRNYQACDLKASVDNRHLLLKDVSFLAFANAAYFGGGLHVAPNANLSDGLAEVITLSRINLLYALMHAHRLYRGTHLTLSRFSHLQTEHLALESVDKTKSILIETDGEPCGQLPADFRILKHALRLIQ